MSAFFFFFLLLILSILSTTPTKTTYVFVDEVEATIPGHESGDLLPVLDQLYSHALTNSGVRLLGLNTAVRGKGKGGEEKKKSVLVLAQHAHYFYPPAQPAAAPPPPAPAA